MTTQVLTARPQVSSSDRWATGGRVLIAAIFVISGLSKLLAPAGTLAYIASAGLPFPELALAAAIAIELIGGVALAIGYRPRIVALVLAGFSIVTGLIFHSTLSDPNQFNHFFKNIAMAGGLIQVFAFGAGAISLDRD